MMSTVWITFIILIWVRVGKGVGLGVARRTMVVIGKVLKVSLPRVVVGKVLKVSLRRAKVVVGKVLRVSLPRQMEVDPRVAEAEVPGMVVRRAVEAEAEIHGTVVIKEAEMPGMAAVLEPREVEVEEVVVMSMRYV
jgi:hypothetical protein